MGDGREEPRVWGGRGDRKGEPRGERVDLRDES